MLGKFVYIVPSTEVPAAVADKSPFPRGSIVGPCRTAASPSLLAGVGEYGKKRYILSLRKVKRLDAICLNKIGEACETGYNRNDFLGSVLRN